MFQCIASYRVAVFIDIASKLTILTTAYLVFLYANGVGIVGYGVATGQVENGYRYDDDKQDPSCYQILKEFKSFIDTPIKSNDIRKILGRKIPFLKTLITIKDGNKLLESKKTNKKE